MNVSINSVLHAGQNGNRIVTLELSVLEYYSQHWTDNNLKMYQSSTKRSATTAKWPSLKV